MTNTGPDDLSGANIEVKLRHPIIAGRHEEQAGQHQPPRIFLPAKQEAHDRKRKDGKKTRRRQDQSRLLRIVTKERLKQARQ